eukprot:2353247-Rhodomonas_salina.2
MPCPVLAQAMLLPACYTQSTASIVSSYQLLPIVLRHAQYVHARYVPRLCCYGLAVRCPRATRLLRRSPVLTAALLRPLRPAGKSATTGLSLCLAPLLPPSLLLLCPLLLLLLLLLCQPQLRVASPPKHFSPPPNLNTSGPTGTGSPSVSSSSSASGQGNGNGNGSASASASGTGPEPNLNLKSQSQSSRCTGFRIPVHSSGKAPLSVPPFMEAAPEKLPPFMP